MVRRIASIIKRTHTIDRKFKRVCNIIIGPGAIVKATRESREIRTMHVYASKEGYL